MGPGGRGRRRHGPLGGHPRRRRDARPRFVRRRARPTGRGWSRSRSPRTPWARSRRPPSSSAASTPSERSPPSTACTSRSTARSTCTRSTPTSWRARPYKFFGPHLGLLERASRAAGHVDAVQAAPGARRGARRAGRPARRTTRGSRALIAAVDYLADVGRTYGDRAGAGPARRGRRRLRRDRRPRARAGGALPARGWPAFPDVRLWGIADADAPRRAHADVRRPPGRPGPGEDRDRAGATRDLRLGRALLRDHGHGAAGAARFRRRRARSASATTTRPTTWTGSLEALADLA